MFSWLKGKYRILSILFFIFAAILVALYHGAKNEIKVYNNSGQEIRNLTVKVCQQTYTFSKILPNKTVTTSFSVTSDSGFVVQGELNDGTQIQGRFGYVTKPQLSQDVRIYITNGGIFNAEQDGHKMSVENIE